MARYQAQTITEKLLITRAALRAYAQDSGNSLLSTEGQVNFLTMCAHFTKRRLPITFFGLYNAFVLIERMQNRKGLYSMINKHIEAGNLIRGGGKGTVFHLTETGKNVLNDVNDYLLNSTPRIRRADSIQMTGKPGPKKGRPMPNRWPPGTPETRAKKPKTDETTPPE